MPRLLAALFRKLGLPRTSESMETFSSEARGEGPFTFGGPSFAITEKGVEGPFSPPPWDKWSRHLGAFPSRGEVGPTSPDKPAEGEIKNP
jgi:hypothetical protein